MPERCKKSSDRKYPGPYGTGLIRLIFTAFQLSYGDGLVMWSRGVAAADDPLSLTLSHPNGKAVTHAAIIRGLGRSLAVGEPIDGTCVCPFMRYSRKTDTGNRAGETDSKMAKVLAPEDVRVGDYVAVMHVVCELPSFLWCGDVGTGRQDEPVRIPFMPRQGGVPLRVRSVCLPFILAQTASGTFRNLDIRRHQLAGLDRDYARTVWKASKKNRARSARAL